MTNIPVDTFLKLSETIDILHEFLPTFDVDIKVNKDGWKLVILPEGDNIGYGVNLTHQRVSMHKPRYLAELIYDTIVLAYTD